MCYSGFCGPPPPTAQPSPTPTQAPTAQPSPAPKPGQQPTPVVVVQVVAVDTQIRMSGITAEQFNTPEQTAAFVQAVEASLSVDATVTNVVATNTARRRLARRELLQSGVDVSYTLQMAIENGMIPSPLLFTSLHPGSFCNLLDNPQVRQRVILSQNSSTISRKL